jgi:hypothetical protein
LAYNYVINNHSARGYLIGYKGEDIWDNNGEYLNVGALIYSNEANEMYNPGVNKIYWLASPSAYDNLGILRVNGYVSRINVNYTVNSFCPIVSLKSDTSLIMVND